MSRASRFHGIYDELAAIGNLVDDVALALRSGEDARTDATDLGELLQDIDSSPPRSVAEIRLAAALATSGSLHKWTDLGRRLLSGQAGVDELRALDELGQTIERATHVAPRRRMALQG